MSISDMFDVRFGLNQDVARRDSRVADYCRWFLKGKSGQAPTEICPEDADFVSEWQKKKAFQLIRNHFPYCLIDYLKKEKKNRGAMPEQ